MEDRIMQILKGATTLRPILSDEGQAKDNFPCITFHFYMEKGEVFGGGKIKTETASCQIDFWYKVKTETVEQAIKAVKQALAEETTFTYPEKDYIFEADKKIHHTYFTFNLIKKAGE